MKRLGFVVGALALGLAGCVTPEPGMTLAQFQRQCKAAAWQPAQVIPLSANQTVAICVGSGMSDTETYQVFTNGVLDRVYSKDEVVALMEDTKCQEWGTEQGTQPYVNCRISLAQLRAQQEAQLAAQRTLALQMIAANMQMMAAQQQAQQPINVNIKANCRSYKIGQQTYYQCY